MNDFDVENIDLDVSGLDVLDDIDTPETVEAIIPKRDLSFFHNIPVDVTLEVASTKLVLGDLMQMGAGAVIALDKLADEPLDVKVNGKLLASAEVVVVNGKYGLKLIDVFADVLSGFKA